MKLFRFSIATALFFAARVFGDFTFVHISDIHVGAGQNHVADAALLAEISAFAPAFVVNTGDVCEYGTDAEYATYRETIKSLGAVPLYNAPGNHDTRWNPRGKEGYTRGVGQPLFQSWDYDGVHFVTLDSTVLLNHWGHISAEQLRWLKSDLEKVGTERPVVIGFHHWIGRDAVQVDNEQALLDLVGPYNVVLWLQGHGHADIEWNINGVPATMVKGLYQGSYNVITVTKDALTITKRFVPDPTKSKELIRDKSVPDAAIPPTTRPVVTIPRRPAPIPRMRAEATMWGGKLAVAVENASAATRLEYRIDGGKPLPLVDGKATPDTPGLVAGDHVVSVHATLPDGRVYRTARPIHIAGVVAPAWSVNLGAEVQSRLVKVGDTLYASTMGTDLVALDVADGTERFRVKTGDSIFTAAHVQDGVAYFGSADHHVYAADARTGAIQWKHKTNGSVLAGPAVARGVVCVGSTDTTIYGLDTATGAVRWTVAGANMYQSKTATDGERFFVGGWDNYFRCIDAASGKELWSIELGRKGRPGFSAFSPAITAPAVGDGKVFVSTNDGVLHALNVADGTEAWRVDWKKMGYSAPLFHDGKVYAALGDEGKVFCADATTGEMRWTAETGSVIYDSSFCVGGAAGQERVFIGNVNGTLNAIDAGSGKLDWQYRLAPGHLLASPVADERFVYVGSMSGQVVALPIHPVPSPP